MSFPGIILAPPRPPRTMPSPLGYRLNEGGRSALLLAEKTQRGVETNVRLTVDYSLIIFNYFLLSRAGPWHALDARCKTTRTTFFQNVETQFNILRNTLIRLHAESSTKRLTPRSEPHGKYEATTSSWLVRVPSDRARLVVSPCFQSLC